jgi:ankyrin repeat protein
MDYPLEKGVTAAALSHAASADVSDIKRIIAKGGIDWAWHDGEADQALPVLMAVRTGNRDYVKALFDAGAPVDVQFKDGSSAFGEAIDASSNNPDAARMVELFVERGANVNRRLPDGRTPLFAAAEGGEIRTVNFLIAHGAQVNTIVLDDTALDAADGHSNMAAARIIHAHGGRRNHPQSGLF